MSVGLFRFNWCNWKEHHVRALHIKQFFSFRTGTIFFCRKAIKTADGSFLQLYNWPFQR